MKKLLTLALVMTIGLMTSSCLFEGKDKEGESSKTVSKKEAQKIAEEYANVKVKSVKKQDGLYKIIVDQGANAKKGAKEQAVYVSLNGEMLFGQASSIEEIEESKKKAEEARKKELAQLPKSEKPVVEAFIMSYCPYGVQIVKGLLPVAETLGDKIDFEIKFVNYLMHGEKELDENLVQYCIDQEEPDKVLDYFNCFVKGTEPAECLKQANVNEIKINACVVKADQEFAITQNFKDEAKTNWKGSYPPFDVHKEENAKYGIKGSPGLVVNGKQISSPRDPASLLETICAGFENQPKECKASLSTASPAPGFSQATGGSSGGGCGG